MNIAELRVIIAAALASPQEFHDWLAGGDPGATFTTSSECDCPVARFVTETIEAAGFEAYGEVYRNRIEVRAETGRRLFEFPLPHWVRHYVMRVDHGPRRDIAQPEALAYAEPVEELGARS